MLSNRAAGENHTAGGTASFCRTRISPSLVAPVEVKEERRHHDGLRSQRSVVVCSPELPGHEQV
jgi:hypothetical protein